MFCAITVYAQNVNHLSALYEILYLLYTIGNTEVHLFRVMFTLHE